MKTIAYQLNNDAQTGQFIELEQPQPQAEGHDLLVKVEAVSVNPIDYKIRQQINDPKAEPRVLG
ncbi:MAG: zinc-binding alcohol dehydrogenase family protein, partial [Methyloprofundus sp.]|nr:zinc-binding alcohol dehydrogenase family protein [Methyloprofundus sp.]